MNIQVDPTSSNLASAMLNSKIGPRAVVGYDVKNFHPSPPNYVARSPGGSRKRHQSPFARSISKPYNCCSVVVVGIRHRKEKGLKDFCSYILRLLAGRRDRPHVTRTLLLFFLLCKIEKKKTDNKFLLFLQTPFMSMAPVCSSSITHWITKVNEVTTYPSVVLIVAPLPWQYRLVFQVVCKDKRIVQNGPNSRFCPKYHVMKMNLRRFNDLTLLS